MLQNKNEHSDQKSENEENKQQHLIVRRSNISRIEWRSEGKLASLHPDEDPS